MRMIYCNFSNKIISIMLQTQEKIQENIILLEFR